MLRINIAVVAAATTTVGVALRPLFHRRGTGLRTSPWKPKWALAMWATILTAGASAALWASRAETFETAVLDVVLTIVVANAATRTINALWYRVNDRAAKHAARTHSYMVMFERSSSEQPFTVVFAVDDHVVSYASTTGWTTAVDGWDVEPCPQHLLDRLTGPF